MTRPRAARPVALRVLAVACAVACTAAAPCAVAQVISRKGAAMPAGEVQSVSAQGVTIKGPSGSLLVGWDQVAQVQGEFAGDAAAFEPLADAAWRARVRLEAGDLGGAEPLLEQASALLQAAGATDGPTVAMVKSGLLRCRAARGANASAVEAWLSLVETGRAEVEFRPPWAGPADARSAGKGETPAPLVDTATGLVPGLPPIFAPTLGLRVLTRLDESPPASPGAATNSGQGQARERARELRALYAAAARAELGEGIPDGAPADAGLAGERRPLDEGLALVWDVVATRAGSAEQRDRALAALTQRLERPDLPGWQEAWARTAIGRAMLASEDAEQRALGMFMLLHVPARLSDHAPSLAGIALEDVAAALEQAGDTQAAQRVRERLSRDFPEHQGPARRGALDGSPLPLSAPARAAQGGTVPAPSAARSHHHFDHGPHDRASTARAHSSQGTEAFS